MPSAPGTEIRSGPDGHSYSRWLPVAPARKSSVEFLTAEDPYVLRLVNMPSLAPGLSDLAPAGVGTVDLRGLGRVVNRCRRCRIRHSSVKE